METQVQRYAQLGNTGNEQSTSIRKRGAREMTTFTTQDRLDAQRTPLTQEQIDNILESLDVYIDTHAGVMQFARAIERAHGITE